MLSSNGVILSPVLLSSASGSGGSEGSRCRLRHRGRRHFGAIVPNLKARRILSDDYRAAVEGKSGEVWRPHRNGGRGTERAAVGRNQPIDCCRQTENTCRNGSTAVGGQEGPSIFRERANARQNYLAARIVFQAESARFPDGRCTPARPASHMRVNRGKRPIFDYVGRSCSTRNRGS